MLVRLLWFSEITWEELTALGVIKLIALLVVSISGVLVGMPDSAIDVLESKNVSVGGVVDCIRLDESIVTMELEELETLSTESVFEVVTGEDCVRSVVIGCGNVAGEIVLEESMLSVVRRPGVNSVSDTT